MPFLIPYDKLHPEITAALPKASQRRRPVFVCEPLKAQEMAVIVPLEHWLRTHNDRHLHQVRTTVTDRPRQDRLDWPPTDNHRSGESGNEASK